MSFEQKFCVSKNLFHELCQPIRYQNTVWQFKWISDTIHTIQWLFLWQEYSCFYDIQYTHFSIVTETCNSLYEYNLNLVPAFFICYTVGKYLVQNKNLLWLSDLSDILSYFVTKKSVCCLKCLCAAYAVDTTYQNNLFPLQNGDRAA